MSRIVAAMSGGVDSSVAAALVAGASAEADDGARTPGPEVVGVWMRTHPADGGGLGGAALVLLPGCRG